MRLYDVQTDGFITDRQQIIDALVRWAAGLMSYSERCRDRAPTGYETTHAGWFLYRTLYGEPGHGMAKHALRNTVQALWRAYVREVEAA